MCGFAGILTATPQPARDIEPSVRRMIATIAHRGPDDEAVWADESAGIALGFRRLAIMDLSPLGRQPMASPSGRYVCVFNGEVYNFLDLRQQLARHGFQFRGGSDTEVMLAAFEQWGIEEAVGRFVGMFAAAIWDRHRRVLLLLRDRLGKKPLYVYRQPGLITFGSELKALAAGPAFDKTIDRQALVAYLQHLYIPAPRTIFAHAMKVPAGSILTIVDAGAPLEPARPYWSLRDVAHRGRRDRIGCETEAVEQLNALLCEAVRCRMRADVPLGALLSGGVDSSVVVALMQEAAARPIRTYTIGFADQDYNEAHHARRVAEHLGTDHTELTVTAADAHRLIPRLPDIFDEPLADPSQVPTCLVTQLARQHVAVALCGDGGDELFGGYNRYVYGTRMLPRVMRLPATLRRGIGSRVGRISVDTWDRVGRVAAFVPGLPTQRIGERVHKLAALMTAPSVEAMYRSLVCAWPQAGAVVGGTPDAEPGRALEEGEPQHLLDRMLLADQLVYLPDDQLARIDRASMAVALELRSPLLDHRVAEFSWRLPPHFKLRGTAGKWILRHVLYRRVPQAIVDRPKMGFSIPIDRWLRGPLRSWAEELLADDETYRAGLLDPAPIRRAWRDLQDGRRQTGMALWAVVMFQAWNARWRATDIAPAAAGACA
jgi:asparagine synthase (glutamine-hydrolysing)